MKIADSTHEAHVRIVQISKNYFRGRKQLDMAGLLPNLANELGLKEVKGDFFAYTEGEELAVRSVEWQEVFDQNRRRHEPRSEGRLLEINEELLFDWAERRKLSLVIELRIERTTDKYKPEALMRWVPREEVFMLTN